MPIVLLGVNEPGHASGVSSLAADNPLPMVQDTAEVDAVSLLQGAYRDVVILDADNRRVTSFNLTQHSLDDPANVAQLRQLLLDAAGAP